MKISHIIIEHQGTCDIIHIHDSCYFLLYLIFIIFIFKYTRDLHLQLRLSLGQAIVFSIMIHATIYTVGKWSTKACQHDHACSSSLLTCMQNERFTYSCKYQTKAASTSFVQHRSKSCHLKCLYYCVGCSNVATK